MTETGNLELQGLVSALIRQAEVQYAAGVKYARFNLRMIDDLRDALIHAKAEDYDADAVSALLTAAKAAAELIGNWLTVKGPGQAEYSALIAAIRAIEGD